MARRDSQLVWLVAFGCGGLVLLAVAGAMALYGARAAREQEERAQALAMARRDEAEQAEARRRQEAERARAEAVSRDAASAVAAEVDALKGRLRESEEKLARAEARIRELEAAAASAGGPVAVEKPDRAELLEKARQQLAELSAQGMFAMGSAPFQELAKLLAELGPDGIAMIEKQLLEGGAAKDRFLAAALLEELKDPASVESLARSLREDAEMIVRRMAAHALAVGQFAAGRDALNHAMLNDADWGVRTNSAYGLAKMGDARGVQELVKWYESPATEAQYKTAILGGIADVGDPATAYIFRDLLQTSQDMSTLVLAIRGAGKTKDASLVPDLQRILDTSRDEVLRDEAAKAIQTLRGY